MICDLSNGVTTVETRIEARNGTLEIYLKGYGTADMQDGAPIYLEIPPEEADPVLYVWSDIAQENYTHRISLKGARE